MNSLKEKAKFKWRSILSHYIDSRLLDGNHRPCPICGGTDRFRFDDRGGHGSYFCSGPDCGPGSGLHLLAMSQHIHHKDAWRLVERVIGKASSDTPRPAIDRVARIRSVLAACRPIAPDGEVAAYLRGRGLSIHAPDGLMEAPWKNGEVLMVGRFAHGTKLRGLHVTFIKNGQKVERDGAKKMYGLEKGSIIGSAIRLNALGSSQRLIVTEGIETGLAAIQLTGGLPAWATGSAQCMEAVDIPDHVTEVLIYGDTDRSFTGQAAAYHLAKRMKAKKKIVSVLLPNADPDQDCDWLDVINRR